MERGTALRTRGMKCPWELSYLLFMFGSAEVVDSTGKYTMLISEFGHKN